MPRRRIESEAELIEYLKRRLGAPQLKIDLVEDQFLDIIDQAIQEVTYYIYDGMMEGVLLVQIEKGKRDYKLPSNVLAITGIKASSAYNAFVRIPTGYILDVNPLILTSASGITGNPIIQNIDVTNMVQKMAGLSQLKNIFDVTINFDYNSNNNILRLHEDPQSDVIMLEVGLEYEPNPEHDGIYDNKFVKKYAEALAWIQQATIYGKYEGAQLVNGSSIAYNDMRERGQQMLEEVKEEIMNNMEPLGIYVA